ncbi:uncharacterized protein LOC129575290 [Sitodiplosis mosellana]|uniref:uncharacterized protein LOC129575290 n=1 Tax=Sitodiplosis mosellana TaxID=263140 RepID=UPI002443EEC3|nr:uncharacterized protein LOC129575290 [Sitodiplosis mosellana]
MKISNMKLALLSLMLYITVASAIRFLTNRESPRGIGFNAPNRDDVKMVAILLGDKENGNAVSCGGAILTKKTILTSAYCTFICRDKNCEVFVGVVDVQNAGSSKINVIEVKRHNSMQSRPRASDPNLPPIVDLGLVIVDKILGSQYVTFAKLPEEDFGNGALLMPGLGDRFAYLENLLVGSSRGEACRGKDEIEYVCPIVKDKGSPYPCKDFGFPLISRSIVVGIASFHSRWCEPGMQLVRVKI